MTDDWLTADRPASELDRIAAAETYLLENAVEVVACSSELLRRKTPDRPAQRRPITLIPNAVDVAAYRHPAPRPGDLPAGRVAVYVGTLHSDRLDVTLCERTARSLQDAATLVLVGPNGLRREDSARLRSAGVVILGARPRDEVIGYLQHADVLVVPHVVTPFTDSLDPIKLYEYQAAGRRIVSTPVAGFRDVEDPRFTIAGGRAYVDAVLAQVTASESPRTPVSAVPDWGDRVTQMGATLARARSGMNGAPG